jgi:hypothetical protein
MHGVESQNIDQLDCHENQVGAQQPSLAEQGRNKSNAFCGLAARK